MNRLGAIQTRSYTVADNQESLEFHSYNLLSRKIYPKPVQSLFRVRGFLCAFFSEISNLFSFRKSITNSINAINSSSNHSAYHLGKG